MSVKVTTWVWEHSRSRGPARLVLLAIADNAHDDGAQAWPSITTLVRKTGLGERTVHRAISKLMSMGELEVRYNAGPGLCNLYRVLMTPAPEAPPSEGHPRQPDTPVRAAPPQERHPTPAGAAPLPPQERHPEPSIEPSRNRQKNIVGDPAADVVAFRPDINRLCELLADAIAMNTGERPKIGKRWYDACRLMLDRDGLTAEQIEYLIRWSQTDEFWRSNILSMSKLREKRLTLIAQARRPRARTRAQERQQHKDQVNREMAAWAAEMEGGADATDRVDGRGGGVPRGLPRPGVQ